MSEPEQIKKLEEELARLSEQLQSQQQTVNRLQRELQQFSSGKEPESTPVFQRLQHSSLENIIGLRLIHLIGIIVLVVGLSLGVKYAIDANLISEKMRILLAYLAGGLLLFFRFA